MGEILGAILGAIFEGILSGIALLTVKGTSLAAGRRRWKKANGRAVRERLIASRPGALVFTAARSDAAGLVFKPDWQVVVVDSRSISAHTSSGEEAWTVAWSKVREIKRTALDVVVIDLGSDAIALMPITSDRSAASTPAQLEIVRRMLAKRRPASATISD